MYKPAGSPSTVQGASRCELKSDCSELFVVAMACSYPTNPHMKSLRAVISVRNRSVEGKRARVAVKKVHSDSGVDDAAQVRRVVVGAISSHGEVVADRVAALAPLGLGADLPAEACVGENVVEGGRIRIVASGALQADGQDLKAVVDEQETHHIVGITVAEKRAEDVVVTP